MRSVKGEWHSGFKSRQSPVFHDFALKLFGKFRGEQWETPQAAQNFQSGVLSNSSRFKMARLMAR
jgi:hypothetical protein